MAEIVRLSRLDKVLARVLRVVMNLPVPVQRRLAGRPVLLDSLTLSPEIQLLLRLQNVVTQPTMQESAGEPGRIAMTKQALMAGGEQPIAEVRPIEVEGAAGPLAARLYVPTSRVDDSCSPLLVFFHGGGMIRGDLDSHDAPCRFLAERAAVKVLSVDYRLAPEALFPAAVEDCAAAYEWVLGHLAEVGADSRRLAVGGDSAGGYLAATTALHAAQRGCPPALQVLVYPVTDFVDEQPSRRIFAENFLLTKAFMDLAEDTYFGPGVARPTPGRRCSSPRCPRGCLRPTSPPRGSIRCATRASGTPQSSKPPACRFGPSASTV